MDFGGLAIGVSRGDAFCEGLEAAHPIAGETIPRIVFWPGSYLDAASGVVSGPALPERSTVMFGGTQGFIPEPGSRAVLFPRSPVLADRDGLVADDGCMATTRVIGPVGSDGADLFVSGDLVQQFWQDRTVAVAARGELYRADVRSCRIHGQMDLAPRALSRH